jgi:hypothetical protein
MRQTTIQTVDSLVTSSEKTPPAGRAAIWYSMTAPEATPECDGDDQTQDDRTCAIDRSDDSTDQNTPFFSPPLGTDCRFHVLCDAAWLGPYSALQIFAEWAHRGLAFATGLLILGTVIAAWQWERDRPLVVWSATLALLLLPVQVLLGRLTVTELLEPMIVTAHLGVAVIVLLLLSVTTLASWLQ